MSSDSPDDPLMSIGTFSRASLVSVKALRRYHEQGLLVPATIDDATGYRSYRVSQLTDAQIIKRLRDLDVPLRHVAEVVHARNPDVTRQVIERHEEVMRDRLADLERVVDELQRTLDNPTVHTPVHLRRIEPFDVLAIRTEIALDRVGEFLGDAYGRIMAALAVREVPPAGPTGALYAADFPDEIDDVTAYVPVSAPVLLDGDADDIVNETLPGGTFAVMTHAGSYESMDGTYRQLGAWVARHAQPTTASIREHYLVSADAHGSLLPADQLRTEIAWPVEADSSSDTTETIDNNRTNEGDIT